MDYDTNIYSCWICRSRAELKPTPRDMDSLHLLCKQCGEFEISRSAVAMLGKYTSPKDVIMVSGWVLNENRKGNIPVLRTDTLRHIVNLPIPSREERMMSLLVELVNMRKEMSTMINVTREPRLLAATYTSQGNHQEIIGLARMLQDLGLVEVPRKSEYGTVRVTSQGYTEVDRLKEPHVEKRPLGFQLL